MSFTRFDGRRRGGRFLVVLLAFAAVLWTTTAAATVMVFADLAQLVELSDVIVRGRVVDQNTFFDEQRNQIATITTVEVDRTFFGPDEKTVQFRQFGGEWGGQVAGIPGDARFEPYEDTFLFLADGQGQYEGMRYLVALGQSKYTVFGEGASAFVVRDLDDMAFLRKDNGEISPRPAERRQLDGFIPELEALIAGIKGGTP